MTDVREVKAQLEGLRPGGSIAVELLGANTDDPELVFARTTGTKVVLACRIDKLQDRSPGRGMYVEIAEVRRTGRVYVSTVPQGAQRMRLDLPRRTLLTEPSKAQIREELHRWRLAYLNGDLAPSLPDHPKPNTWSMEEIEALLYVGIRSLDRPDAEIVDAARAACEWVRRRVLEPGRRTPLPELDLIPTLAALRILLHVTQAPKSVSGTDALSRHGVEPCDIERTYARHVARLLEEIGSRGMRSYHVEALTRGFPKGDSTLQGKVGVYERLERLSAQMKLTLEAQDVTGLAKYAANAELRTEDPDVLAVANAVVAAASRECSYLSPTGGHRQIPGAHNPVSGPGRVVVCSEHARSGMRSAGFSGRWSPMVSIWYCFRAFWRQPR